MFQLTAKSGDLKGTTWLIGERALVVGRASDCDVRIPDPVISRHHFELTSVGGALHFKDLGGLNAVMINGAPSTTAVVNAGDEIRIGRYLFLVTRTANAAGNSARPAESVAEGTLSEEESVFLSGKGLESSSQHRPRTEVDLDELFRASRMFSRTTSVPDLIGLVKDVVLARFEPDRAVMLLLRGSGEDMVPLTGPETAPQREELRSWRKAMLTAMDEHRGTLGTRIDGGVASVLTAPIALGQLKIGAFALERAGADHLYEKPDLDFLVALAHVAAPFFKAIEKVQELEQENRRLRQAEEKQEVMLGSSKVLAQLKEMVRIVAPSRQPVLIIGPTGAGKELVASLVHHLSDRVAGPFVVVNCAAIPKELFESEFFGHEKGAFTGATERKIGLMEHSDGGTLFLDEIGDLAPEHQARILRAVETGVFRRVGGKQEVKVDFRVVAATNKELAYEIEQGRFREDLYHRLKAVELRVPGLAQRRSDIPELADHFLRAATTQAGKPAMSFSPKAIEKLMNYPWPGNIRQLKSVVEVASAFCRSDVVDVADFPFMETMAETGGPPASLSEVERLHIIKVLEYTDRNMVEAAKLLGIGRSTLYVKLDQYGLK